MTNSAVQRIVTIRTEQPTTTNILQTLFQAIAQTQDETKLKLTNYSDVG
ncbi:hypothetical protein [Oscillatoria sp. FACHB-1407]|nr:hypothetical protein [Oscillatoria sp. FACHB-1407]